MHLGAKNPTKNTMKNTMKNNTRQSNGEECVKLSIESGWYI